MKRRKFIGITGGALAAGVAGVGAAKMVEAAVSVNKVGLTDAPISDQLSYDNSRGVWDFQPIDIDTSWDAMYHQQMLRAQQTAREYIKRIPRAKP